jgi:Sulfotransferase family
MVEQLTQNAAMNTDGSTQKVAPIVPSLSRTTFNVTSSARPSTGTTAVCRTRHLHGWASEQMFNYGRRNRSSSFLWSIVREPTQRYISEFFHFYVSRGQLPKRLRTNDMLGKHGTSLSNRAIADSLSGDNSTLTTSTENDFVYFLRNGDHANHHYLNWLSTSQYHYKHSNTLNFSNQIIDDYDFIGISERFDESMVALALLTNTPLRDVLYVSSKNSGGYDDGAYQNRCFKIISSFVSPNMQRYLDSDEWQRYVQPEMDLYVAISDSLDLTIDHSIGRARFDGALKKFREVIAVVNERCTQETIRFPCSTAGERRLDADIDCLWRDLGCGFDCLDRVADELSLP